MLVERAGLLRDQAEPHERGLRPPNELADQRAAEPPAARPRVEVHVPDPAFVRVAGVRIAIQPTEPDERTVDVACEEHLARLREAVVAPLPVANEALHEPEALAATDVHQPRHPNGELGRDTD